MKRKTSIIITVLLFGGLTVFNIISGILGLCKSKTTSADMYADKGGLCGVTGISYAVEMFTVEHTLNILIPTGKEHFYLAADDEDNFYFLIKETPSWYKAHFDEDGEAYSPVSVFGEVRKFDSENFSKLRELKNDLSEYGITISSEFYLSGNYKTLYILRLTAGLSLLAAGILFVFVIMRLGSSSKAAATAAVIFGLAALLFNVFVMLCGETV